MWLSGQLAVKKENLVDRISTKAINWKESSHSFYSRMNDSFKLLVFIFLIIKCLFNFFKNVYKNT